MAPPIATNPKPRKSSNAVQIDNNNESDVSKRKSLLEADLEKNAFPVFKEPNKIVKFPDQVNGAFLNVKETKEREREIKNWRFVCSLFKETDSLTNAFTPSCLIIRLFSILLYN